MAGHSLDVAIGIQFNLSIKELAGRLMADGEEQSVDLGGIREGGGGKGMGDFQGTFMHHASHMYMEWHKNMPMRLHLPVSRRCNQPTADLPLQLPTPALLFIPFTLSSPSESHIPCKALSIIHTSRSVTAPVLRFSTLTPPSSPRSFP